MFTCIDILLLLIIIIILTHPHKFLTKGSKQGCSWMKGENVLPSGAFGTKRLFQQSILKTHEWVNSTLEYMTFKTSYDR